MDSPQSDYFLGFFFVLDFISTITLVLDLTWAGGPRRGPEHGRVSLRPVSFFLFLFFLSTFCG